MSCVRSLRGEFRTFDPASARVVLLDGGERPLATFGKDLARRAAKELERLGVELRMGARVVGVDAGGVDIEESDGITTASPDGRGYGQFHITPGHNVRAHWFSFDLSGGVLVAGMHLDSPAQDLGRRAPVMSLSIILTPVSWVGCARARRPMFDPELTNNDQMGWRQHGLCQSVIPPGVPSANAGLTPPRLQQLFDNFLQ